MDLVKLPSILWRWWWVVDSIVVVTIAFMGLRVISSPTRYDSQVRVQITAPQLEDLALFDSGNRSSSYLRDDLTLVRNNFVAVVKSRQVYDRTVQELKLTSTDPYSVDVRPVPDSDFVDLSVSADTADLAQSIANTHAKQALRYYGELRAMPAASMKAFLDAQIAAAQSSLPSTRASSSSDAASSAPASAAAIESQQARDTYKLLLGKQAEAALTEEQALRATYIQLVDTASPATHRSQLRTFAGLLLLALLGSLGFGAICAVMLESVFPRKSTIRSARDVAAEGSPLSVARSG